MLKKILSVAIVFFFSFQADASYLSKYVNTYNLGSNSNSGIFVQDIDTKEVLYKKNSQQPLNPASILKTLVLG